MNSTKKQNEEVKKEVKKEATREVKINKAGAKRGVLLALDAVAAAVLLGLDQYTKYLAIRHLKGNPAYVLIDGVLELQYLENRGSAFGMLQNQKFFILFVGIVFLLGIFLLLLRLPQDRKFRIVHILLTFIIAGGIGNMVDRFRFDYVVDFISFILINYPVFNVADCYIVAATVGLFFLFLFVLKEEDLDFLRFGAKEAEHPKKQ